MNNTSKNLLVLNKPKGYIEIEVCGHMTDEHIPEAKKGVKSKEDIFVDSLAHSKPIIL